jgi:hypothetical protein
LQVVVLMDVSLVGKIQVKARRWLAAEVGHGDTLCVVSFIKETLD